MPPSVFDGGRAWRDANMVDGEVSTVMFFGTMALSQAGLVIAPGGIEQPVEVVFNAPLAASFTKRGRAIG